METAVTYPVKALLFDLGGVLIDIDFERTFRAWEALTPLSVEQIRERFYFDEAYQQHERGQIDLATYCAHLRQTLQLEGSDAQIAAGWNALFIGEIPETLRAIEHVAPHVPCYAFTNTNAEHQRAWATQFPTVVPLFRRVFSSWELGLRKPEHAAFRAVCQHMDVPVQSVLFFDDTVENVEEAKVAGLQAVHVRSPADVEGALKPLY